MQLELWKKENFKVLMHVTIFCKNEAGKLKNFNCIVVKYQQKRHLHSMPTIWCIDSQNIVNACTGFRLRACVRLLR